MKYGMEPKCGEPALIGVSGVKNSGKTTVLCGILPHLTQSGLRVAVIKHDGHDFAPDVPGTDSYRIREAGASGVAVYSNSRSMAVRIEPGLSLIELINHYRDMDLILLEGGKHSSYPKIEVLRAAVSAEPVCDLSTLIALCTDTDCVPDGTPVCALDDYRGLARIIMAAIERWRHDA